MKEIETLIKKIIKKSKDKDAKWTYSVEYSHDTKPAYRALIRFTKDGVPPVIVATESEKQAVEALEGYLMGEEAKDINIKYHEYQIKLEEEAISFHRGLIREYENPSGELPE